MYICTCSVCECTKWASLRDTVFFLVEVPDPVVPYVFQRVLLCCTSDLILSLVVGGLSVVLSLRVCAYVLLVRSASASLDLVIFYGDTKANTTDICGVPLCGLVLSLEIFNLFPMLGPSVRQMLLPYLASTCDFFCLRRLSSKCSA